MSGLRTAGPRRRAWLLATVLAPMLTPDAARSKDLQLDRLAPAGAAPLEERGSWDVAVADAVAGLAQALGRDRGPLDFQRWALPADATLAQAEASVREHLGAGWARLALPAQGVHAQYLGWEHADGPHAVYALAWLEPVARIDAGPARRLAVTAVTRRD